LPQTAQHLVQSGEQIAKPYSLYNPKRAGTFNDGFSNEISDNIQSARK
jgi:hypothetical protein